MSTKKLDSAQIAKLVADAGKSVKIADADLRRLIERIADILPPLDGAEEEKVPACKKQFVILVSDPLNQMPEHELAGWVLQIPEEASALSTEERIQKAAYDFNASRRGRKLPVQTVGEACESVPSRNFKEVEVWVKTKTPVLVLTTRNEIPKTDGLLADDNRGGPKSDAATAAKIGGVS